MGHSFFSWDFSKWVKLRLNNKVAVLWRHPVRYELTNLKPPFVNYFWKKRHCVTLWSAAPQVATWHFLENKI